MIHVLTLLPKLFQYFQWFRVIVGFVRPLWPHVARLWGKNAVAAATA